MIHKQSVWLALLVIVSPFLILAILALLDDMGPRLVDCPRGQSYSIKHLRCVGHLEIDRR
jgi:hypothetical protein